MTFSGMGVYADGAILTFGLQFIGFAVAAILQTEVFYDVLGGINFLLLAVLSQVESPSTTETLVNKNSVFVLLFVVSRGWLLVFLAWRAHHRKGDSRFDGIRDNPSRFFVYWMVQAVWVYCISLPILVVASSGRPVSAAKFDLASWMLQGMGWSVYFEIWSDIVKAKWVAKGRPGGFCTEGPWKRSRHPNYAAEISTWVFAAAYAVVVSDKPVAAMLIASLSPLFTIQILTNTSGTGVWNAEGKNLKRYYEHKDASISQNYVEYRKTPPPLFPTVGVPYESLSLNFQRQFCFEWEIYEYKSKGKSE
mmetsp:Transcript_5748/g.8872  ORF Transcript_5748/g.8872 Transcript_5748/m.8872 type:complete len:306 (+) Transcript_5748:707-1624(+)